MQNYFSEHNIVLILACFSALILTHGECSLPPAPMPNPEVQESITFTPPQGWKIADASHLPKSVKVMVVGKGDHEYPPSINLGTENYTHTLSDYLKRIKEINAANGTEWKNLGPIQTLAGEANLSQVDTKTQWGDVRMMHVILLKNNVVYILTASALKNEFAKFYTDFFESLRSLRFVKNIKNETN